MRVCMPVPLCQALEALLQKSSGRNLLQAQNGDGVSGKLDWPVEGERFGNPGARHGLGLPGAVSSHQVQGR